MAYDKMDLLFLEPGQYPFTIATWTYTKANRKVNVVRLAAGIAEGACASKGEPIKHGMDLIGVEFSNSESMYTVICVPCATSMGIVSAETPQPASRPTIQKSKTETETKPKGEHTMAFVLNS